jgi:hypothetical protein
MDKKQEQTVNKRKYKDAQKAYGIIFNTSSYYRNVNYNYSDTIIHTFQRN